MTELENRVVAFVVEQTGCRESEVQLNSRIEHDLGVTGDDACDLMDAFARTFEVDLSALDENWSQHFGDEVVIEPGCLFLACIATGMGVTIHVIWDRIPLWGAVPPMLLLAAWVFHKISGAGFGGRDLIPVTVQDMVDAAAAGRWVKEFPDETVGA